ncbi:D-2-hydroxyacid dehydrogenase [Acidimicrobiia bacterium EGI L10123]|uniref:NAD(P)-dependent oxidoreductase n=1 Tax=Salinilacustrithrix flava TaxID=2957203 RepID=UPI003D7C30F3|nr:D-2-hydroxyacid dehydrogenase [Acidimicrobiia bacterium EGI L10123]
MRTRPTSYAAPITTVLVTAHQLDAYGERLRAAAPAARFLAMDRDGTIRDDGVEVSWEDARADVAYGSADIFDDRSLTRRFFGWLLRAEQLQWLQMAAAGVDHPAFGALLDGGVRITSAHVTDIPIAEYVLAQVLRATVPIEAMDASTAQRQWTKHEWREVHGSRWLVVGLGAIGSAVAVRARAFGAQVTGVRRSPAGDEPVDEMIAPDDLLAAVPNADVVVLCTPATRHTVGMVGADFLGRMAPQSILVNVGRGQLIDEVALRRALDAGRPARAILDVAVDEPPADDSWLWDHPAVTLTAHTSAGGDGRHARAADVFAGNLARFVAGEALVDEVTAESREAPPG